MAGNTVPAGGWRALQRAVTAASLRWLSRKLRCWREKRRGAWRRCWRAERSRERLLRSRAASVLLCDIQSAKTAQAGGLSAAPSRERWRRLGQRPAPSTSESASTPRPLAPVMWSQCMESEEEARLWERRVGQEVSGERRLPGSWMERPRASFRIHVGQASPQSKDQTQRGGRARSASGHRSSCWEAIETQNSNPASRLDQVSKPSQTLAQTSAEGRRWQRVRIKLSRRSTRRIADKDRSARTEDAIGSAADETWDIKKDPPKQAVDHLRQEIAHASDRHCPEGLFLRLDQPF